jgi:hypothetical protein
MAQTGCFAIHAQGFVSNTIEIRYLNQESMSSNSDEYEDASDKAEFDEALYQVRAKLDMMAERAIQARKEGRTRPFPK